MKQSELTSRQIVQKALVRSERFGVFLKSSIALLIITSVLSIIAQLEGITKIGAILIIASNIFTTVLLWIIHLRNNQKNIFRYIVFILDILSVQLVVFLYSFASNSPPDYGIEHTGLMFTAIGVVIASGAVNSQWLPLVSGGLLTVIEGVFITILIVKGVPILNTPNEIYLKEGILGTRMLIYKVAGYMAVTISIWFISRIHDRMVRDVHNYSNKMEEQKNTLDAILTESQKVSGSVREMGIRIKQSIADIKENIESGMQRSSSVAGVFNDQLVHVKLSSEKAAGMLDLQNEIRQLLTGQKDSIAKNRETVMKIKSSVDTIGALSRNSDNKTQNLLQESKKGEVNLMSVELTINKVREVSNDITKSIVLIQDIADRTNLLSMNASITAARAGETGKSFNVVAAEIRKLAENAAKNTSLINSLLKQMNEVIEQSVDLTSISRSQFKQISSGATASSESIRQIADLNTQLTNGFRETLDLAEEIEGRSENIKSLNESLDESANEVSRSMSSLLTQTESGTETVNTLVATIDGINTSIEKILEATVDNEKIIDKLITLLPEEEK
ncbi:MAG: hypothetical protein JW969_16185 [Spirochaetales bacterium]|nr:hypothetical protein [Spirochaetales bacterium]